MASVCVHRSRSSRNRAANHRQAGASSATGYQTVNCSSNSVLHRIGCAFGKNPALTPYQRVAEFMSKNRVQTPKLASQRDTLRAGLLAPLLSESSVPGSIVFFSIKSLCSDLHYRTDSLHWDAGAATARVSKRPTYKTAACLRARYCTNLTCPDLNKCQKNLVNAVLVIGSSNNQPHFCQVFIT